MNTPLQVLILEDQEDDAELVLRQLRRGGYDPNYIRVETAMDMQAALEQQKWEIILSDYSMPQFSALAALAVLQSSGLDIPFIVISGTIGEETAIAALQSGASDFILKGNLARLIPAIGRELREAEVRHRRKQAEVSLAESEARYRQMFEENRAAQLVIDPETWAILDANPAACEFYQCQRTDLTQKKLTDISLPPHDLLFEHMAQVLSGHITAFSFRHRLATGEQRDVEIYPSPIGLQGRTVLYCIIHDITTRKLSEQALKQYAERLKILHTIDQAILTAQAPEDVAHLALEYFMEDKTVLRTSIALLDFIQGEGLVYAVQSHNKAFWPTGTRVSLEQFSPADIDLLRKGEVLVFEDMIAHPHLPAGFQMIRDQGIRSYLAVPLIVQGELIGSLNMASGDRNAFAPEQIPITREVADQVAIAIHQSRLREQIQRHTSELEHRVLERTTQLLQAKERIEAILNSSSDAIMLTSFDGVIQQTNPAFHTLLGYIPDEILGDSLLSLPALHSIDVLLDAMRTVVTDRRPKRIEIAVSRKNKSIFEGDLAISPVMAGTDMRGLVCSLHDITTRKNMERRLQENESRYRHLAENAQDMVYRQRLLPTPKLEYINHASTHIIGYTPEEVYANPNIGIDIIHPDDLPALNTMMNPHGSVQEQIVLRWRHKDDNDSYVWIEHRNVYIRDEIGQIVAFEGIGRDVSVQKRIEDELRRALEIEKELNELKTRFVSMVSHDFRTPLTVIQTSSELLQNHYDQMDGERRTKQFGKIQTQIQRMVALLNDVLMISRADAGALPFNPIKMDMDVFCRELAEEFRSTSDMKHTLIYTDAGKPVMLDLDEKLMQQVVINLVTNALKYSPSGSTVTMELSAEDNKAILRVTDQGIGIPEADQPHLFHSFHRAKNVGSIEGTGLGLAIVKRGVEAHGGAITFETQVGVGTTFIVTLPLG